ncbi:MAG TPA: hypothetical protein VHP32_05460 [Ignavibacteria bacterium]|nr:hypothetical protein [Ignavibacteria bacterium]
MDNFLDDKIKTSLMVDAPYDFTDRLLKEIELSKQFAIEDKKEAKVLKYVTAFISLIFVSAIVAVGYLMSTSTSPAAQRSDNLVQDFSNLVQQWSYSISNSIGFSSGYLLLFIAILGLALISSFMDKLILRKR